MQPRLGAVPLRPLVLGAALGLDLDRRRALGLRAVPLRPLGALGRALGAGIRGLRRRGRSGRRRWWPGSAAANLSVSIGAGGPPIGWVPLAPWEAFHAVLPRDAVLRRPHQPPPPAQAAAGAAASPCMYGNQGVPGAVTVVPRDVLVRRQPVSRGSDRRRCRPPAADAGGSRCAAGRAARAAATAAAGPRQRRRRPARRAVAGTPPGGRVARPRSRRRRRRRTPAPGTPADRGRRRRWRAPGTVPGRRPDGSGRPDGADGADRRDVPGRGAGPIATASAPTAPAAQATGSATTATAGRSAAR
ncbi:MAG: hypothetical protein MZW92_55970 [Comamonadaceae bacterium]|nr:hypothetical protein [Comamonadaceae bacterium]